MSVVTKIFEVNNSVVKLRMSSPSHLHMTVLQEGGVDEGAYVPSQCITMTLCNRWESKQDMDAFIASLIDLRIQMELDNVKVNGSAYRLNIGKHTFILGIEHLAGNQGVRAKDF